MLHGVTYQKMPIFFITWQMNGRKLLWPLQCPLKISCGNLTVPVSTDNPITEPLLYITPWNRKFPVYACYELGKWSRGRKNMSSYRVEQKLIANLYRLSNNKFVIREVCTVWLKSLLLGEPARGGGGMWWPCRYQHSVQWESLRWQTKRHWVPSWERKLFFLWKQNDVWLQYTRRFHAHFKTQYIPPPQISTPEWLTVSIRWLIFGVHVLILQVRTPPRIVTMSQLQQHPERSTKPAAQ
jgi:hypothetical protein